LVALRTPYKNSRYISPVFNAVKTLKFSLPLSISEALGKSSVGFLDILIIGILAKTYSVGLYRAASDLAVAISLVLMIFVFMYMPLATEMYANDYKYQWQDINQRIARWSMLATFPLFAVLVSFPNDVIHIVYGEEYKKAAMALRLLAIGYFGHSMVGLTAMNLVVAGFTKIQMTTHLLAFVLNISGNLLLIPILGINGAAISSVASLWAMNIFALIVMKRKLDLSPFNKIYFKNLCLLFSIVIICYLILIGSGLSSEAARLSIFLLLCTGCMGIMLRLGYLIDSTDRRLFKTLISGSIISSIKK
jgi:O-antigen/teichoic acid export membrane protein